jgi:hypothetical protein
MLLMTYNLRRLRSALALAFVLFTGSAGRAGPLAAQGLPSVAPINPLAASRSGLYFQPYREPRPGRWTATVAVDYASTIEYNLRLPTTEYVLDTELLRVRLSLARDIGTNTFVLLDASAGGAYDGFMDGFLDWYHGTLGIDIPERELRPRDDFLYHLYLDDHTSLDPPSSDVLLGDVRLGVGLRHSPKAQTVLSVTLPTATGPTGYRRGVPSVNASSTLRLPVNPRLVYEGSLGLGYTPSHGRLEEYQREVFVAGSSGLRFRFWGPNSLYGNLFYHSPYYSDTRLPALDRRELSLDFGWIVAPRGGPEWRLGMTEDLEPGGPGIDLVFRLGVGF